MRKRKHVYFHLYRDNFSIATASHWCAWLSYCLSGMSNLDEVVSEANYWRFLTYKCIFIQVWTLSSYWVTNDCSKLRNTIRKVKEKNTLCVCSSSWIKTLFGYLQHLFRQITGVRGAQISACFSINLEKSLIKECGVQRELLFAPSKGKGQAGLQREVNI